MQITTNCEGCKYLSITRDNVEKLLVIKENNPSITIPEHVCMLYMKVLEYDDKLSVIIPYNGCRNGKEYSEADIIIKLVQKGIIKMPWWYKYDVYTFANDIIKLIKSDSNKQRLDRLLSGEDLFDDIFDDNSSIITDFIINLIPQLNRISTIEFRNRIEEAVKKKDYAEIRRIIMR